MTISEIQAVLVEAGARALEACAAIEDAVGQLSSAAEAASRAAQGAASCLDQAESESVLAATARFNEAEAVIHSMLELRNEAQAALLAGKEHADTYIQLSSG